MKNNAVILSINPLAHDTSAALMIDGEIGAACEQERYTKDKHSRKFPSDAVRSCLEIGKVGINDVCLLVVPYDIKLGVREHYLRNAMESDSRLDFLKNDVDKIKAMLDIEDTIRKKLKYSGDIEFVNHHMAHLASAYYTSGFSESLLVCYDGLGEVDTMSIAVGKGESITIKENDNKYPHSLGLLYAAITYYLGWKYASDEGIVMGLASYGNPHEIVPGSKYTYYEVFEKIISIEDEFTFRIDFPGWMNFYDSRSVWVGEKFINIFGPKREENDKLTQHHKNIAAALQKRIEYIVIGQLKAAKIKYNQNNLCISGGVGLNCSMNGEIASLKIFENIYIVPPSGDSGTNIGACFLGHKLIGNNILMKKRHDFYLGSRFNNNEIKIELDKFESDYEYSDSIDVDTAKLLSEGNIIGWFQGGSEFGPRALGNRSILTKPYPAEMKDYVNKRIKFREEFRPFAPAIMHEYHKDYFEINYESPHMLMAVKAKESKKNDISATVHVDGSARVQTVKKSNNVKFWKLINSFYKLTKVPVLLNTSFNVKGQPVVDSPKDAIETFYNTNLDFLVIGDYIVKK